MVLKIIMESVSEAIVIFNHEGLRKSSYSMISLIDIHILKYFFYLIKNQLIKDMSTNILYTEY